MVSSTSGDPPSDCSSGVLEDSSKTDGMDCVKLTEELAFFAASSSAIVVVFDGSVFSF